jgi:membrane-bound lytic murein transglycosylase A
VEVYFLQVQGSGTVRLPDGSTIGVHYDGNNGHPYTSIGKILIEQGLIKPEEGSLPGIKRYLLGHAEKINKLLYQNPRYIFFKINNTPAKGSLQIPLTAGYSIATDPSLFPKGGLSFIKTVAPVVDPSGAVTGWKDIKRFVLNQDEGGAIKGPGRVDIFWGAGSESGLTAGSLKESGELYFLIQR